MAKSKVLLSVVAEGKNIKIVQGDVEKLAKSTSKAGKSSENLGKKTKKAETGLKGVGQQSANTTKNFSKSLNLIGGEGRGLVGAYAGLAANIFAVTAAFQFFQSSFDLSNIIKGQEALGAVTGTAYKTITNSLIEATEGQLRYADAAKATAIGTAAGLTAQQLEDLSTVAKNASLALGRDLTDSFNRLIRGTTKAEPELLDELGIILRLDPALKNYAVQLGKTKEELNAFERTQAVVNEVIGQGEEKFEKISKIMDPDAFALQQFIRSFDDLLNTLKKLVADGLTPVFQFLSKNTVGLVAALTAFAIPIVKSILPNFKEWKEASESVTKNIKKNLDAQRTKIKEVSAEYSKFTSVEKARAAAQQATAGLKSTSAGVSLIQGGEAEKLTKKQLRALLSAAERNKGIITEMSSTNQAVYIASLRRMVAETDSSMGKIEARTKKAATGIKLGWLQLKGAASSFASFMVGVGGKIAGAISLAFNVVAIVGMITMLIEAGKALYNWWKGLDPAIAAQRELEESTKALVEKYALLNEEIGRSTKVRLSTEDLLNASETIDNVAGVIRSVNFNDLFEGIVLENTTGEINKELRELIASLTVVDDRFGVLYESLRTGVIPKEVREDVRNLANSWLELGAAQASLPEQNRVLRESLQSLVPQLSPLDTAIKNSKALVASLSSLNEVNDLGISVEGLLRRTRIQKGSVTLTEEELDFLTAQSEEYQKQFKILTDLERSRGAILLNNQKILQNEIATAAATTLGITIADKRADIDASRLSANNDLLKLANESISAQIALNQAQEGSPEADVAREALELINLRITKAGILFNLQEERNKQAEYGLRTEELTNELLLQKLQLTQSVNAAQNRLTRQQSGADLFGSAQASAVRNAQRNLLAAQIVQAEKDIEIAQLAIERADYKDAGALIQDKQALQTQEQTLANLKEQLRINENLEQITLNNIMTETESLRLQKEAISLNPLVQAFEQKVAEGRLNGANYSAEQLAVLRQQVQEQYFLNEAIQLQEGLVASVTDGMSTALGSLIDGTATFKDAFKNMAVSILKDIASMISRMLVMRALMTVFQPAAAGPANIGASSGQPQQSAGSTVASILTGRNGGVASKGKMMSGYAYGGIATGSTSGYPAMLHGTEAIVPLPNGRSIPVEMTGSTQQNNVTVNVAIDNQGNATTNTSQQGPNIGNIIAQAVQKELQNQKRAGGILSPYGAA